MITINETKRAWGSIYTIMVHGHSGKVQEAARRTEGVKFVSGTCMNGKAGMNNRYTLELDQPSQELYQSYVANYKAVCQEAADARKAKEELPDFIPVQAQPDWVSAEPTVHYPSDPFGAGPIFKVSQIVFEDGTTVYVEGEHDVAYIPSDEKLKNMDEETLERLAGE